MKDWLDWVLMTIYLLAVSDMVVIVIQCWTAPRRGGVRGGVPRGLVAWAICLGMHATIVVAILVAVAIFNGVRDA